MNYDLHEGDVITKAAFVLLVVVSLFVLPYSTKAQSMVFHSPVISNVKNSPQDPVPGYSVNVTADVNGYPRSLMEVHLVYSTSVERVNRTVRMFLVGGNMTIGSFFGVIPTNVSVNGISITYFVVATDVSGFVGISDRRTFDFQPDLIPPDIFPHGDAYGYLNTPIVNYSKVVVNYDVSDAGSGVRQVTVKYSNSTDLTHNLSMSLNLTLAEGDRYDGLWNDTIPPMPNGTVYYQATAVDYSGNTVPSDRMHYEIGLSSYLKTSARITIYVYNLNLTSRTMTTYFDISVSYPSPYPADSLPGHFEIDQPSNNVIAPEIPRQNGFDYHMSYIQEIGIYDVNLWPFDSYSLDLTFSIANTPNLNSNNTSVDFALESLAALQFSNSTPSSHVSTYSFFDGVSSTKIYFHVDITRKPTATNPIMQAIYAVFFVLGSIAIIKPSNVSRRLEVFLGLFTFIVILFFTITPILQNQGISNLFGPVLPQALLIGLTWSVATLMAVSLTVVQVREMRWFSDLGLTMRMLLRHIFNIALASVALYITQINGVVAGFQSNIHFMSTLPQVNNTVVECLFIPLVFAAVLDCFKWLSYRRNARTPHTDRPTGSIFPKTSEITESLASMSWQDLLKLLGVSAGLVSAYAVYSLFKKKNDKTRKE